jgi:3-oxoacyl-ACP reductase-like protein
MSIFGRIKDAIFGRDTKAAPTAPPAKPTSAGPAPTTPKPASPATPPAPAQPVDVEAVLVGLEKNAKEKLNWRTSIVDLMKLLGIDSSLQNRKDLAKELGYTGDTNDSASMNIWLHKRVMKELAANGGKVPAGLQD